MNTLRVTNMLATVLVGVAIAAAACGWPRTTGIALSGAVYLLVRSVETLRASNNRSEK